MRHPYFTLWFWKTFAYVMGMSILGGGILFGVLVGIMYLIQHL